MQVVGTTHRYKSKYITTIMYKPKHRRHRAGQDANLQPMS